MKNIATKIVKDELIITINLKAKTEISKSKKSLIIASTEGNQKVEGSDVTLGLNLYRKNPDFKPE